MLTDELVERLNKGEVPSIAQTNGSLRLDEDTAVIVRLDIHIIDRRVGLVSCRHEPDVGGKIE